METPSQRENIVLTIDDIIASSNKINQLFNYDAFSTFKPKKSENTVLQGVLTEVEKEILCFQVKEYARDYVSNLNNLSINMDYDWINNITDDNSFLYFYDLLLNGIELAIACMNDILDINNIGNSYNKTLLMNAIIIYGSSVYYLSKLMKLQLVIKTQNNEIINLINEKINIDHKVTFYNAFNTLIGEVITHYEHADYYNINVQQLANDKYTLLSLLNDCCENLEALNFNSFLL